MVLQVGISPEDATSAFGGQNAELNVQNLKVNEEYHVRIVGGVKRINRCWYPYLILSDKGEWVTTWTAPIVGSDSVLESLAAVDQRITVEKSHKPPSECKSRLAPASSFLYTCIDRADEKPVLKKLICNWSVGKSIQELQEKEKRGKEGFLEYGLIFLFDIWITKKLKDKARGDAWNNIEYGVEGISSDLNPFSGIIPISALKSGDPARKQLLECFDRMNPRAFTEEELVAIKETKLDLEIEGRSQSADDIMLLLHEKPIYLKALGQRNQPIFVYPEELAIEAKRLGIPYVMDVNEMISRKLGQSESQSQSQSQRSPETQQSKSAAPTTLAGLFTPEPEKDVAKDVSVSADQSIPLSELLPGIEIR